MDTQGSVRRPQFLGIGGSIPLAAFGVNDEHRGVLATAGSPEVERGRPLHVAELTDCTA